MSMVKLVKVLGMCNNICSPCSF